MYVTETLTRLAVLAVPGPSSSQSPAARAVVESAVAQVVAPSSAVPEPAPLAQDGAPAAPVATAADVRFVVTPAWFLRTRIAGVPASAARVISTTDGSRRWDKALTDLRAHVGGYQGSAVVRADHDHTRPLTTPTYSSPCRPTPPANGQGTSAARVGSGGVGVGEDIDRTRCGGRRRTGECGCRWYPVRCVSVHQARLHNVLFALAEASSGD